MKSGFPKSTAYLKNLAAILRQAGYGKVRGDSRVQSSNGQRARTDQGLKQAKLTAFLIWKTPVLDVELSQLRQWLKVPEGKLNRWVDIKRFILEPALKQINDNPDAAG